MRKQHRTSIKPAPGHSETLPAQRVPLRPMGNDAPNRVDPLGLTPPSPTNQRPVLSASESKPFNPGDCGKFEWSIKWNVSPKSDRIGGGSILQEVQFIWDVRDCRGNRLKPQPTVKGSERGKMYSSPVKYLEAWGVTPDSTDVRIDVGADLGEDRFAFPGITGCTKGTVTVIGFARYYPKNDLFNLPSEWTTGWGFSSGDLWSGTTRPQWPVDASFRSELVKHSIVAKWDCCSGDKATQKSYSTIEPVPGS